MRTASGHCASVADLRQAADWHRALDAHIAQEAAALADARAEMMRRRSALDASREALRRESAALEQARRQEDALQARCRRRDALRQDDAVDEAALDAWRARACR